MGTYVAAPRVAETSTTTGTGNFTLGGAIANHQAFSAVCAANDTVHYAILADDGSWEMGLGTLNTTTLLARNTPMFSSNGGSVVTFAAGNKVVYLTFLGIAQTIHAAASKATPADLDEFAITDSAASYVMKSMTFGSIKGQIVSYINGIAARFTNKVIDDTTNRFSNTTDGTKMFRFDTSGITTGNTRIFAVPNQDDTLAGIGATQTLSNKTLSAPTLSGDTTGGDGKLTRVMLKDQGVVYFDSTTTNALDYTNGSHQRWAPATGAQTLSISNWPPSGNLGELLIEGVNLGAATITWPTINWVKSDGTTTTTFSSNGVTLQSSGTDWVLLWTRDGGATIYGKVMR